MLQPSKPVVAIVKLPQRTKNRGNQQKLKELLKFSFQAKIDVSYGSTRAENKTREIQNTTIDASLSQ